MNAVREVVTFLSSTYVVLLPPSKYGAEPCAANQAERHIYRVRRGAATRGVVRLVGAASFFTAGWHALI